MIHPHQVACIWPCINKEQVVPLRTHVKKKKKSINLLKYSRQFSYSSTQSLAPSPGTSVSTFLAPKYSEFQVQGLERIQLCSQLCSSVPTSHPNSLEHRLFKMGKLPLSHHSRSPLQTGHAFHLQCFKVSR